MSFRNLSPKLICNTDGSIVWHYCQGCHKLHPIHVNPPGVIGNAWDWDRRLDYPTFSPSVRVFESDGKTTKCHYFLKKGQIQFCSDSPHALAGQTVELLDIPEGVTVFT